MGAIAAREDEMMEKKFSEVGLNQYVDFDGDQIVFSGNGQQGPYRKVVPVGRIGQIDYTPGKGIRPAVLRFRVPGEVTEIMGQDPNSVMITGKKKKQSFEELRHRVQAIIDARPEPLYTAEELEPGAVDAEPTPTREDIASAVARMGMTFGVGRLVNELPRSLRPSETVSQLSNGSNSDGPALVVLTDQRLLVMSKAKMLFTRNEAFELRNISHVEFKSGVGTGKIWIHSAGRKKLEVKRIFREDAERIIQAVQSGPATSPPAASASAASVSAVQTPAARLLELKQLRDAGVLDDEQYAEKSAPLIAQL